MTDITRYVADRYKWHKWVPVDYLVWELGCDKDKEEIVRRVYPSYILVETMAAAVGNILEYGYEELAAVAKMMADEPKYIYAWRGKEYRFLAELIKNSSKKYNSAYLEYRKYGTVDGDKVDCIDTNNREYEIVKRN